MAMFAVGRWNVIRSVVSSSFRNRVCSASFVTSHEGLSEIPEPPKKPVSAFLDYFATNRNAVMHENPDMSYSEVTKKMGEMWRNAPSEEKEKFIEKANIRMSTFKEEYQKYNDSLTVEQKMYYEFERMKLLQTRKLTKRFQAVCAEYPLPKKPLSPKWLYLRSVNMTRGDMPFGDYMRKAQNDWENLSESQRETFLQKHDEEMAKYREDHGRWIQKIVTSNNGDILDHGDIKDELRRLGLPKRPLSSYFCFLRASKLERGTASVTDFTKEMAQRWKQMSEEQKQVFVEEAQLEKTAYQRKLSDWESSMEAQGYDTFVKLAKELLVTSDLDKEEKETLRKQQEKEKQMIAKQKEKLAKQKEKEKLLKQKEREKLAKQKEKEKLAKQKEKLAMAKEKEKLLKQKEKVIKEKEKMAEISKQKTN